MKGQWTRSGRGRSSSTAPTAPPQSQQQTAEGQQTPTVSGQQASQTLGNGTTKKVVAVIKNPWLIVGWLFKWVVVLFLLWCLWWVGRWKFGNPAQQQVGKESVGQRQQEEKKAGGIKPISPARVDWLEPTKIQRWLMTDWQETAKVMDDVVRLPSPGDVCFFHVQPKRGIHWLPLDLALLPETTGWKGWMTYGINDAFSYSQLSGESLWMLNESGGKMAFCNGLQKTIGVTGSDLRFFLEAAKPIQEGNDRLRFGVGFKVEIPDELALVRRSVEKRFGMRRKVGDQWLDPSHDLNKDVPMGGLPAEIEGVSVYWDISIRCYPLWTDDGAGNGRWMKNWKLSDIHLKEYTPRIRIMTVDGSSLPGQSDSVVFDDEGELLVSAFFQGGVENLQEKVKEYRRKKGLPEYHWDGSGRLCIYVPRYEGEAVAVKMSKREPVGVTVRVTLMIRPDHNSYIKK